MPTRRELAVRSLKRGRKSVGAGAKWAAETLDPSALRSQVGDFMESAREAINEAVESELRDLRRSIRRQRRKLGV